jgi:uncharacterized protein (DUF2235 family)
VSGTRECPPIRLVGVWDTVGALGLPGPLGALTAQRHAYHQVGLHDRIENAVHAVAIDERRRPFVATLFSRPGGWTGQLHQAWFAGVHSDIGGSYAEDSLANLALHWMLIHAAQLGLALDQQYLSHFKGNIGRPQHDSMTWLYRLAGPVWRPIGELAGGEEDVHHSAVERLRIAELNYAPDNLVKHQASPNAARVVPPAFDAAAPHIRADRS